MQKPRGLTTAIYIHTHTHPLKPTSGAKVCSLDFEPIHFYPFCGWLTDNNNSTSVGVGKVKKKNDIDYENHDYLCSKSRVPLFPCSSGRDKRIPGRPPPSPRMERPRGQGPRAMPPQGERSVHPGFCHGLTDCSLYAHHVSSFVVQFPRCGEQCIRHEAHAGVETLR